MSNEKRKSGRINSEARLENSIDREKMMKQKQKEREKRL